MHRPDDQTMSYQTNSNASTGSFNTYSSAVSSFSADSSSWDSSSTVETPIHTPTRQSFDFMNMEDVSIHTGTPIYHPDRLVSKTPVFNLSSDDFFTGLNDSNLVFPTNTISLDNIQRDNTFTSYIAPGGESFSSRSTQSAQFFDDNTFSPITEMGSSPANSFVVPSQTTYGQAYGTDSPLRPVKALTFDLQYDNQVVNYDSVFGQEHSPATSMVYQNYASPNRRMKSASSTPSKSSSLRQPLMTPLPSSAALHQVQEQTLPQREPQAERHRRKQFKRAARETLMPDSIRIEKQAKKPCPYHGCTSKFQRQEHLKRHMKTHDKHTGDVLQCMFCPKLFRNRADNFKSHIKLHATPEKKSSRTKYCPSALAVYESMKRKGQRSVKNE